MGYGHDDRSCFMVVEMVAMVAVEEWSWWFVVRWSLCNRWYFVVVRSWFVEVEMVVVVAVEVVMVVAMWLP